VICLNIINLDNTVIEKNEFQSITNYLNPKRHGGKTTIGISEWEPNSSGDIHTHSDWDEHFFILDGEGKMIVGDTIHNVSPNMVIQIPREVPHTVKDAGENGLKMVYVLTHYDSSEDK